MSGATEPAVAPPEPDHGFADSRRLTGPNRWFGVTAVTLTPLGSAARLPAAHARWAERVGALAAALGWPAPRPRAHLAPAEVTLAFAAPADLLFTATEANEWAWERAAAEHGEAGFDIAQDIADDDAPSVFAARAGAEAKPALAALRAAAAGHGLPLLVDDDSVSAGSGNGSSAAWPLSALPAARHVDWRALHAVPTALVTGSNGKTTTVRLLAAMARQAGLVAGYCSTEGVFVGDAEVAGGDYAGPAGARAVLRHAQVQLAVLETARGGILRRGLAVGPSEADVAVVTNISPDHLGEYGVQDADDLAEVKLVVAHALHGRRPASPAGAGTLVLNADDAVLMAAAARLPHAAAARRALFAHDDAHPALAALRAGGGSTCGMCDGVLVLTHNGDAHALGAATALPLTLGGAATHNIANAAAAALAAAALGLPVAAIAATLHDFGSRPSDNPGRLERWRHGGATVLVDYAHNPDGLAQLLTVARALAPQRLGLLLGQAGNRDDGAIRDLATTAATFMPDRVVIKELPQMLRGRAIGAVPALLRSALLAGGTTPARIADEADEFTAATLLLRWAQPGDVVILPVHTAAVRARLTQLLSERDADAGA